MHGQGHCARAIMESIAFLLKKILADFARSGVDDLRGALDGRRSAVGPVAADQGGRHRASRSCAWRRRRPRPSAPRSSLRCACGDFPDVAVRGRGHGPARQAVRARTRYTPPRLRAGVRAVQRALHGARAGLPTRTRQTRHDAAGGPMEPLTAGYVSFGTQYYEPENLATLSARAEAPASPGGHRRSSAPDPVFGEGAEPERAIRELQLGRVGFPVRQRRELDRGARRHAGAAGVPRPARAPVQPRRLHRERDTLICPAAGAGLHGAALPDGAHGFPVQVPLQRPRLADGHRRDPRPSRRAARAAAPASGRPGSG